VIWPGKVASAVGAIRKAAVAVAIAAVSQPLKSNGSGTELEAEHL